MPRPWRTVYKSAHKEVKIRPRDGHTLGVNFSSLIRIILGLAVLLALYSLVAEYWPLILFGLAFQGMQSKQRR